ncbi:MAG: hypothetical protein R2741_01885 [Methanolobus sp.]
MPPSADGYFDLRLQVAFVDMKKSNLLSIRFTGFLQSRFLFFSIGANKKQMNIAGYISITKGDDHVSAYPLFFRS